MSGRYNLRSRAQTTPETQNAPETNKKDKGRRLSDIFLPGRKNKKADEEQQAKKDDDESRRGSLKRKPSLSFSFDSSDSEMSLYQPPKWVKTLIMGRIRETAMTKSRRKKKEEKEKQERRERKERKKRERRPATAEEIEARVAEICTETWWAESKKVMDEFREEYDYFLKSTSGPPAYNPSGVAPMYAQWEDGRDGWICPPPFTRHEVQPTDYEMPNPAYLSEIWGKEKEGDGHPESDPAPDSKTGPGNSRSNGSSGPNVTRVTEGEVDVEMSGANKPGHAADSNEKSNASGDKRLIGHPKPVPSRTQILRRSVTRKESGSDSSDSDLSVSSQLRRLSLNNPVAATKSGKGKFVDYPVQDPPIVMHKDVPPEWNWDHNDDDLDEGDIEANITRCIKRIQTGIVPQIWKMKLKRYEAMLEQHNAMMASEPAGLGVSVVKRLKDLEAIAEGMETMEDVSEHHLQNVYGVIDAYRTGNLGWEKGKIVCFYKGKPLGTWKAMSLEEVNEVCLAHGNQVWVEGLSGPGPAIHGHVGTTVIENENLPDRPIRHFVPTLLGIRGHHNRSRMRFRDDTGADFPTMFMEDIDALRASVDTTQHDVIEYGFIRGQGVSGKFVSWVIGLEIKVLDDAIAGNHMTSFKVQPFTIFPRGHTARTGFKDRLSGSWWRSTLYTASAPDNNHRIYVSQTKDGLGKLLPDVSYHGASKQPPPYHILEQGREQEFLAQENEPVDKGVDDPMDTAL